jgi:hypothetical protein
MVGEELRPAYPLNKKDSRRNHIGIDARGYFSMACLKGMARHIAGSPSIYGLGRLAKRDSFRGKLASPMLAIRGR